MSSTNRKDYIRNKAAAEQMADEIRDWWHQRGYTKVTVWVESNRPVSPFGTKLPMNYSIRSNICFHVDSIENGMIE